MSLFAYRDAVVHPDHVRLIRILVVDRHRGFAEALARRLDVEADLRAVGTVSTGAAAERAVDVLGPDVVILDMSIEDVSAVELTARLTRRQPPVRVIGGPKTHLNWPSGLAVDAERDELYVANDSGNSILVFRASASGDIAPIRTIEGPRTGIKNPTGLFLDTQNDELWVSNFGNHTVTVYKPTVSGNAPPMRMIRSAPPGEPALMIGNPGGLAYDTRREEILVPN